MARILVVADSPEAIFDVGILEERGHRALRCWGGPTGFAGCPMLKTGSCPLPDVVDLIVFACGFLNAPLAHRTYRGIHLLNAYRHQHRYGRLPMLLVTFDTPPHLSGIGAVETVDPFAAPEDVADAIDRLLEHVPAAPGIVDVRGLTPDASDMTDRGPRETGTSDPSGRDDRGHSVRAVPVPKQRRTHESL